MTAALKWRFDARGHLAPRVLAKARRHAKEAWPEESVGIVRGGDYVPQQNMAEDPRAGFVLSDAAVFVAEAVIHSHPDGTAWPSKADMESQIALGVPYGIVPMTPPNSLDGPCNGRADLGAGDPFFWPDTDRPYLQRPYRHGVTDCFTLVRDWLRRERGIELPPLAYDWGWHDGEDLLAEGALRLGWERVAPLDARPGDVVFLGRGRATHCGVLLEDGQILHHPASLPHDPAMLSRRTPIARLARLVVGVVRPA